MNSGKKIKDKIAAKKHLFLRKEESLFFRNDEDGRVLFYPWGYPGTGFYLDAEKKRHASIHIYLPMFFLVVFLGASAFLSRYGVISWYGEVVAFQLAWVIFPAWYFYKVHAFTKGLKSKRYKGESKPRIYYVLLFCLFVQLITIMTAIYAYQFFPNKMSYTIFVHSIYLAVIGYFTSNSVRKSHV